MCTFALHLVILDKASRYTPIFGHGPGQTPPKGRPKGTPNKATLLPRNVSAEILKKLQEDGKPTPLEFLIMQMQDEKNPMMLRKECAKDAAPYLHRKQPIAIDGGEGDAGAVRPITFLNVNRLASLPDDQLEQLVAIAGQLSDDGGDSGGEGASSPEPSDPDVSGHGEPAP